MKVMGLTLALNLVLVPLLIPPVAAQEAGAKELFFAPLEGTSASRSPRSHEQEESPEGKSESSRDTESASRHPSSAAPVELASPAASSLSGLRFSIELIEPGQARGRMVTPLWEFRSEDRIRLHFRSNVDGYITLMQLGASGIETQLFPDPAQGLVDSTLEAGESRVLPSPDHWFRFDDEVGTEWLVVLFARSREELERAPSDTRPPRFVPRVEGMLASTNPIPGSKDLVLETETEIPGEIGTYGVNLRGAPIEMLIPLKHR